MLFKSQLVTQASGSIGGMTGSHNRGGMYFRARAIPTNPATAYQVAVRNLMGILTARWGDTLTQAQRDLWQVYSSHVPLINPLGDPVNIGGMQHFVRSNVPRLQAGLTLIDAAPTTYNLGSMYPMEFAATADDDKLATDFDALDAWAHEDDAACLVYGSRPVSPTIQYFKGPYRYAGKIEGDSVAPPSPPVELDSPFPLAADQLLYAQVRVSRADGRLTTPFRGSCVVAAT